jgi:hypothetical protein
MTGFRSYMVTAVPTTRRSRSRRRSRSTVHGHGVRRDGPRSRTTGDGGRPTAHEVPSSLQRKSWIISIGCGLELRHTRAT